MASASLSAEAEEDLKAIVQEIARYKPAAASRWLFEISERFELLAREPHSGGSVIRRRWSQLRCLPFGVYLIYYRPELDGIVVIRVVHGARDQTDIV